MQKVEAFTPGSWCLTPQGRSVVSYQTVTLPQGERWLSRRIAHLKGNDNQADARLIAAAPELYEALKDTLSVCEYVLSKPDTYNEAFGQLVHAHVETAQAALRKARGETQ